MSAAGSVATVARARLGDLLALTKPRITGMVLSTTAAGLYLAPRAPGLLTVVAALAGVVLVVGGANALNMYLERDVDGKMARTAGRPLPSGRLDPVVALVVGVALSSAAVPLLTFGVNPLTGLLAAVALVTYVVAYTPLKRRSVWALQIGAVAGAMPPLLGWTAATGTLGAGGLNLFAILYLWQLPHFLAIALFRVDDYARAGLKTMPGARGADATRRHIVLYTAALVGVTLLPAASGWAGPRYLAAAALLGALFLGCALRGLAASAGPRWPRLLFVASLIYLPLLLGALLFEAPR